MRAVIQRVKSARVAVAGETVGTIDRGIVVFLAVGQGDAEPDADYVVEKAINQRIFEDEGGKMNRSLLDQNGEVLIVSQFTLMADCRKGRRPSFDRAADAKEALRLFDYFVRRVKEMGIRVATGTFQTFMEVTLINQGPVTFLLDSKRLF
jgi:D-aminoacyl-tRNA deacylase